MRRETEGKQNDDKLDDGESPRGRKRTSERPPDDYLSRAKGHVSHVIVQLYGNTSTYYSVIAPPRTDTRPCRHATSNGRKSSPNHHPLSLMDVGGTISTPYSVWSWDRLAPTGPSLTQKSSGSSGVIRRRISNSTECLEPHEQVLSELVELRKANTPKKARRRW